MALARTSTGTFISSAAALTASFGAGAAAGDFGLLTVETANQNITTPSGWTAIIIAGTGTAGAALATEIEVYKRVGITSGEVASGISVSDSGDHQGAVLLTYSGVDPNTPTIVSSLNNATGTAIVTSSIVASNIKKGDIVLAIIVTDRDSATVSTNTSPSWANVTGSNSFIVNASTATGAGGGIIINELVVTADATGDVSFSCNITSSLWMAYLVVIKAPVPYFFNRPSRLAYMRL